MTALVSEPRNLSYLLVEKCSFVVKGVTIGTYRGWTGMPTRLTAAAPTCVELVVPFQLGPAAADDGSNRPGCYSGRGPCWRILRRAPAPTGLFGPGHLARRGVDPAIPAPPLSKAWLKGEADAESLALKPLSYYGENDIDFRPGLAAPRSSVARRSSSPPTDGPYPMTGW